MGAVWALVGLCLLALVSQFGSSVQAQAVDAAAVVFAAAALLAAHLVGVRPLHAPRIDRLWLAWGAFLAWATISTVASGRAWASFVGETNYLAGLAALAALTLVALAASDRGAQVRTAVLAVAPWVALAQIGVVVIQLLVGAQPSGSLPNSTYLGELMLLVLPWVIAADAPAALPRAARLGIAVAGVACLAAAGSRVAAVVGLAWLVVEFVGRSRLDRKARLAVSGVLVLVVLAAGFAFARAEIVGSAGRDTLGERPAMWSVAARALTASPLTGYGPDGFTSGGSSAVTPQLAEREAVVTFRPGAGDPHNLVAWVALSTGLIGLVLFLWAVVEIVLGWRAEQGTGEEVAPAVWGVSGAALVFLTAPAAIQVLPLFALVLGLSRPRKPKSGGGAQGARVLPAGARFAVAGALAAACLVWGLNAATRFGLEEYGPQVSPAKASSAASATSLWSVDPHLAYLASLHLGYAAAADPSISASRLDLDAVRRASTLDPTNPFYALEYARTLKYYGEAPRVVEAAFLTTFERYPAYPLARAEYAAFLAEQGRLEEAAEQVRIAELVPDTDPARAGAIEAARELIGGDR